MQHLKAGAVFVLLRKFAKMRNKNLFTYLSQPFNVKIVKNSNL